MWAIYRANVLRALINRTYSSDTERFAEFIAKQYDACMRRGGDTIWGVPVANGNVKAMADVIKNALQKGLSNPQKNFNLLEEICPAAFEAYWMGAEMAAFPNPLFRPLGWSSTPPAPGTIQNIGPDINTVSTSVAKNKALVEALKLLVEELKGKTLDFPGYGEINVYETAEKISNGEKIDDKVKKHPIVKAAVDLIKKLKEAKNKRPSTGSQIKKSIKIPFPELPDREKLIKETKEKLREQSEKKIIEELKRIIIEQIINQYVKQIKIVTDTIDSIQKPTKEEIKRWVKDEINGITSSIKLPDINLPKLPTKEEFEKNVNDSLPTKEQIKTRVDDMVEKSMPQIPYFQFVVPTYKSSFSSVFINPFINYAKIHLANVGGTMIVTSLYSPVAPPAPAFINWTSYRVLD
jgi:hypothetical protein